MSKPQLHVPTPGMLGSDGFVHIPVRLADYINEPGYNPTLIQKLRNKAAKRDDEKPQWIAMSQNDYIAHWAKDNDGKFLPSVQVPSQGRVEWLRHQIRVNDLWRTRGQMLALARSPENAFYW